jgi:hypothetical protein
MLIAMARQQQMPGTSIGCCITTGAAGTAARCILFQPPPWRAPCHMPRSAPAFLTLLKIESHAAFEFKIWAFVKFKL